MIIIKNSGMHPEVANMQLHKGLEPVLLTYSKHALERAEMRHVGREGLPAFLTVKQGEIVEVEFIKETRKVFKIVVRKALSQLDDIIYILVPLDLVLKNFKVLTIYINKASDKHKTLNKERFK